MKVHARAKARNHRIPSDRSAKTPVPPPTPPAWRDSVGHDVDWRFLLDHHEPGCVSVFQPTYAPHGDGRQDPVRLRNLLRDAEHRLRENGLDQEAAERILEPARTLVTDDRFWHLERRGLALFCAPGTFRAFHLPIPVAEHVAVGDHFALRPLLPLHATRGTFYVLALSRGDVRLVEGWREGHRRVELEGLPTSVDEAIGSPERGMELRTHAAGGGGGQGHSIHGHSDQDQEKSERDVMVYFQRLSRELPRFLRRRDAPVVLATVRENETLFRRAGGLPGLVDEAVTGNPEKLSDHELHGRAWTLAEPVLLAERDAAMARYEEMATSGRTGSRLEDVLTAAEQGRVDVLFLPPGGGNAEQLERATFLTLERGGKVFPVDAVPGDVPAAALYRY